MVCTSQHGIIISQVTHNTDNHTQTQIEVHATRIMYSILIQTPHPPAGGCCGCGQYAALNVRRVDVLWICERVVARYCVCVYINKSSVDIIIIIRLRAIYLAHRVPCRAGCITTGPTSWESLTFASRPCLRSAV
jgi:hypothetical protein